MKPTQPFQNAARPHRACSVTFMGWLRLLANHWWKQSVGRSWVLEPCLVWFSQEGHGVVIHLNSGCAPSPSGLCPISWFQLSDVIKYIQGSMSLDVNPTPTSFFHNQHTSYKDLKLLSPWLWCPGKSEGAALRTEPYVNAPQTLQILITNLHTSQFPYT